MSGRDALPGSGAHWLAQAAQVTKTTKTKKLCGIARYRRVLLDSHLSVQPSLREAYARLSAEYLRYGSNPFRREYRFSHSLEIL